jgi:predicted glycosyltransferase
MVWNIGRQLPRILWAIRRENREIARLVRTHAIQGILSDNRYGCFNKHVNSVLLSHQLHIQMPYNALAWPANKALRMALNKFDTIWVPDVAEPPGLAGVLSHGSTVHPDVRYAGILTRMRHFEMEPEYDVAVVLSGPEPQRSILEQRLLEQAMEMPHRFIIIQGQTHAKKHYYAADDVEVVSYLTTQDLNNVLMSSKVLVCRSGYSSIMDLAGLNKKAVLIPTPGQTEQEYLAKTLSEQQLFISQKQDAIDLDAGIKQLTRTTGLRQGVYATDAFKPLLKEWVEGL